MEDNVKSILHQFDKDVEDEYLWDRIESIRAFKNFTHSEIANSLLAFMIRENCKSILNLDTINLFEKEINIKSNALSSRYKPNKKIIHTDTSFFGDYINDENVNIMYETPSSISAVREKNCWKVNLCTEKFKSKLMFQKNTDIYKAVDIQGKKVCEFQLKSYNESLNDNCTKLNFSDMEPVGNKHFEEIYTFGRLTLDHTQSGMYDAEIFSSFQFDDEYNGAESIYNHYEKLTPKNIAIQNYSGFEMPCQSLVIDQTDSYSFFLGENVIIKGQNPTDSGFFVSSVLPRFTRKTAPINVKEISGNLQIVIACGLLANRSNSHVDPLKRLMKEIKTNPCHALIFTGPIVDRNNTTEQKSDEPFNKLCWERLELLSKFCVNLDTHLIIVPSTDDATEVSVFPQPGFCPPSESQCFSSHLIHFVPNPAIVKIGPYKFGISSADILRHLSTQEISKNCSTPRLRRLCEHILAENNFYPLKPAHPELSVDMTLWAEQCGFGTNPPHCLILPSKLNNFIENINGVACINPGYAKSSYCRLDISEPKIQTESIDSIVDIISQCNFSILK